MDLLVKGIAKVKYVAFRQNSRRVVILSVVSEVRLVREVLSRRHWCATWIASCVGILVKREITSKETKVSSLSRVWEDMNLAKSWEFRTL